MVETIRLESGHTLTGIVGSNPTLSAIPPRANEKADNPCDQMARRHSRGGWLQHVPRPRLQGATVKPSTEPRRVSEIDPGAV